MCHRRSRRPAFFVLLLFLVGCQTEPARLDLSRTVTVDELLTAWETDTGHVRGWHGKSVAITGFAERYELTPAEYHRVELRGDRSPSAMIVAISPTVDLRPADRRRVTLRGKLYCEGSRVALDVTHPVE